MNSEEEIHPDTHTRILQAREQERLRLAREIHDGPAQILANAVFELEFFEKLIDRDPASVKPQLAQLRNDMREGLAEVRRFIFDLRSPSLSEQGLFVALSQYLSDFEKHFGIKVEQNLPQTADHLSATTQVAVYRIVQEALRNIRKHAAASKVMVRAAFDEKVLRLSIEDDGKGFDQGDVERRRTKSFGLISMRERAELIGAELEIASRPGHGTRIELVTPVGH